MSVLLGDFASNLCDSHKDLRIATLRILAFHEPFGSPGSETDQAPAKRRKRLDGQRNEMDPSSSSQVSYYTRILVQVVTVGTLLVCEMVL